MHGTYSVKFVLNFVNVAVGTNHLYTQTEAHSKFVSSHGPNTHFSMISHFKQCFINYFLTWLYQIHTTHNIRIVIFIVAVIYFNILYVTLIY